MSEAPGLAGSRSWAWLGRIPAWTWDVIPALLVGGSLALVVLGAPESSLPTIVLALAGAVPLLARRRAPLAVLAMTGTATFAAMLSHSPLATVMVLPVMVALYTVDTRCSRRWSLAASAVAFIGAVLAAVLSRPLAAGLIAEGSTAPAAVIAALWLIGDNLRVRRAYVAGLEERAAWVDAQRATDAQRAADTERARIARELHDVVAHHVAVIAVQAGAARMLDTTTDERTRDLLGSIENASHQAMSELRRLLGLLRHEDGGPDSAQHGSSQLGPSQHGSSQHGSSQHGPSQHGPAPQPGLGQLDQLIDQVRQAGLPVELTVAGEPCRLPDWVDLSAYRIVQEALTNVLKHAGPARTRVGLRCDAAAVTLIVTSQAPVRAAAPPGERPGHGLIGMRERAAMAGGELRAGPTADGGFEVFARLPLEAARPAPPSVLLAGDRR